VFERANERVTQHAPALCPHCCWVVALNAGAIEDELAALTPDTDEDRAWHRLLPDPGLFVRTLRAMLASREAERDYDKDSPCWAQLLGHVTAHRPVVLVHSDCAEHDCEHDDVAGCYDQSTVVACAACSPRAGNWAGEWAGQYEVVVRSLCSVLTAVAEAFPGAQAT
jgi:hypothetical protein